MRISAIFLFLTWSGLLGLRADDAPAVTSVPGNEAKSESATSLDADKAREALDKEKIDQLQRSPLKLIGTVVKFYGETVLVQARALSQANNDVYAMPSGGLCALRSTEQFTVDQQIELTVYPAGVYVSASADRYTRFADSPKLAVQTENIDAIIARSNAQLEQIARDEKAKEIEIDKKIIKLQKKRQADLEADRSK